MGSYQQQRQGFDQSQDQPPQGPPPREKPDYAAISDQFDRRWSAADIEIVWDRNDELRTVSDLKFFLYYCKQWQLDPVVGEVVASYRWNSAKGRATLTPIVTIGVMRKRRAELCDGIDQFVFNYGQDKRTPESVSGTIYRKGCARPFSATVYYEEYAATDRKGAITSMWARKSHMMVSKCLEAQLSRLGFFDVIGDLLIDEETQKGAPQDKEEEAEDKEFTVGTKEAKPADPAPPASSPAPSNEAPKQEAKPAPVVEMPKPAAEKPKAEPKADPKPEPVAPAEDPKEAFSRLIGVMRGRIGGEALAADKLVGSYFVAYLGTEVVPKDRAKVLPALTKLVDAGDEGVKSLKEGRAAELGHKLSGRQPSPFESEMEMLGWTIPLRKSAREAMKVSGLAEDKFVQWLQTPMIGQGENAVSLAALDVEALSTILPMYCLVKGRAFEPVDYAIARQQPIGEVLKAFTAAAGKPVKEWDAPFATACLDEFKRVTSEPKTQPATADEAPWDDTGLPFGS